MSKTIMGVKLNNRMHDAPTFQSILSKYGCYIETRIGLHSTSPDSCDPAGIIVLNFADNTDKQVESFEHELSELGDVDIQKMVF